MRIGLIGLGGMGRGLAKNMAGKGLNLTVADLDQSRVWITQFLRERLPAAYPCKWPLIATC